MNAAIAALPDHRKRVAPNYLYAIEFTGGLLKVGRAADASKRVAQHAARLLVAGLKIANRHIAPCGGDGVKAEAALIRRCAANATEQRANEWFVGIAFSDAIQWLEDAAKFADPTDDDDSLRGLYMRRDCYPFPAAGGYICRACCVVHGFNDGSAFLCGGCLSRGYGFDTAQSLLTLGGKTVRLWSGIEPGTEVREFDGVSCEDLRPDSPWFRVADAAWRYGRPLLDYYGKGRHQESPHPDGRPTIDVAAPALGARDAT